MGCGSACVEHQIHRRIHLPMTLQPHPLRALNSFFFSPVSVSGFALMRMGWAAVVLWYGFGELMDVMRYFSDAGILPAALEHLAVREEFRFTLLDVVRDPGDVLALYLLLMAATVCILVGFFPRIATVVAVLLLFSFHERNPLVLGGGETVLRHVGLLLMFAPVGRGFSLRRLRMQWKQWCMKKTLPPPRTIHVWPQRLLLWQLIVIYVASGWDKLLGDMWLSGTAVQATLYHSHFARFPVWMMDVLAPLSPVFSYATLLFEFLWLLMLLPSSLLACIGLRHGVLKRTLLVLGIFFHGGIFLLLDVGSFSAAMLVAYLGILTDADFHAVRGFFNARWLGGKKPSRQIAVLYDTYCGLCTRAMFTLLILDHLHRLKPVDFHDEELRKKIVPDITYKELDKAIHIRFIRTGKTLKGFEAFRTLSWHLPVLIPVAPFLYLPGISRLGRRVYKRVAARRKKCKHESCSL